MLGRLLAGVKFSTARPSSAGMWMPLPCRLRKMQLPGSRCLTNCGGRGEPGRTIVGGPPEPKHWQGSPKLAAEACRLLPCQTDVRHVRVHRLGSPNRVAAGGRGRVMVKPQSKTDPTQLAVPQEFSGGCS